MSSIPIHKHINIYSLPSLSLLVKKANLELLGVKADPVDLGWIQSVNPRALGRKIS
jgi:hypothetical protein